MLDKIKETTDFIFAKTGAKPDYGIVLGSGLGGLVNEIQIEHALEYTSIPNFPVSTVKGHGGKLIFGKLGGKKKDAADQARAEALEWLCNQYYVEVEAIVIASACVNLN